MKKDYLLKRGIDLSMSIKTSEEQVKESVCNFYLNNKSSCDINYANATGKNIGKLYEDIVDTNIITSLFVQTSFVVITANRYEKNILHYNIFEMQNIKIKKISINLFPQRETKQETYAYCFKWNGYTVLHIEAQSTGSYTIGGSADIVRYVLDNKYIVPRGIISFGICFGADENNSCLGDVIISKKVYPYFIGSKIQEEGYFVNDDNVFSVVSDLSAKIKFIIDKNAFSELDNTVYFGNYITGEAVVSQRKARDQFVKQTTQKIIAGEMEGYGLFKESRGTYYSIPCLIIKSICDWAIMKNFKTKDIFQRLSSENNNIMVSEEEQKSLKDRIQAYSANQAFKVLNILLDNKIFEESIFSKIVLYVEEFRGHAIYAKQIKNAIQEIVESSMCGIYITNEFVIAVIKELLNLKLLIYDAPGEIENIVNEQLEDIDYIFSIREE